MMQPVFLFRETQRISLRAFLRNLLSNPQIAKSRALEDFLTFAPTELSDDNIIDITRRKAMDEKRLEEQKRFYEIARKRAAELDVYMEQLVKSPRKNSRDLLILQIPAGHHRKKWLDQSIPRD